MKLDTLFVAKNIWNWLVHGENSVIMNSFLLENLNLFPDFTVGVRKWIFSYKGGIIMEIDPFPALVCWILNILL